MGINYQTLANAGNEKVRITRRPVIDYPGTETIQWHGYTRHNFELEGHAGFIVEPPNPAPGLPWSWCTQWAEAFVERTPALKLLERGFHHVFLDVFETKFNEEGIKILEKFYALLQNLGFHPQGALIGMSYGGLCSLRWAQEHPETVGAIYLDAPVCDLGFTCSRENECLNDDMRKFMTHEAQAISVAYGVPPEKLHEHPLSPLNNYHRIAEDKVPILCIRSGQDQSVNPVTNIDILEKRLKEAGGDIQIVRRDLYGHHPHGLDDPQPLVDFILQHYPAF